MKRNDAIHLLRQHAPELRKLGVVHACLFGSVARDDAEPNSDVDVFITPEARPFTLVDLVGVKQFLENDVFHCSVDVFTLDGLKSALPMTQERINAEIVDVF